MHSETAGAGAGVLVVIAGPQDSFPSTSCMVREGEVFQAAQLLGMLHLGRWSLHSTPHEQHDSPTGAALKVGTPDTPLLT